MHWFVYNSVAAIFSVARSYLPVLQLVFANASLKVPASSRISLSKVCVVLYIYIVYVN